MSRALKIVSLVLAYLALDAIIPRPDWAPKPLVSGNDILAALSLPGTAQPKAKHPVPTEEPGDNAPDVDDVVDATPTNDADAGAAEIVELPQTVIAVNPGQAPPPTQPAHLDAVVAVARPSRAPGTASKPFMAPALAGWDDFRARLAELEAGKRKKVRVVHLGDSEIAGDDVTRTLRQQFRRRYGNGGLGFVLAFKPWNWYAREGYDLDTPGAFSAHSFVYGKASDGDYGPGGIAFDVAEEGAVARLGLENPPEGGCRVSFHYEEQPNGGELDVVADDDSIAHVQTAAAARHPAVKHWDLGECPSELQVKTLSDAKVRIFGWSVESNKPGIVWSSLGVISANAAHLQHYAPGQLTAALQTLEPDLVVLGYGLNLVHVATAPPRSERTTFEQVLASIRTSLPAARCLAVSPYPVAVSEDGTIEPSPSVPVLTRYQREAAAEAGCAFLDREALSGGPGAAMKWLEAKPRLLSGDYVHLTTVGAEKMGKEMARVLLDEKPEAL